MRYVLLCLLAAGACGEAKEPQETAVPAESESGGGVTVPTAPVAALAAEDSVVLIDAGKEPRQPLRYTIAANSTQEVRLFSVVSVQSTIDDHAETAASSYEERIVAKVGELLQGSGTATLQQFKDAVSAYPGVTEPMLEPIEMAFGPRGVEAGVSELFIALPKESIGLGGRWKFASRWNFGLEMRTEYEFELVERGDNMIKVAVRGNANLDSHDEVGIATNSPIENEGWLLYSTDKLLPVDGEFRTRMVSETRSSSLNLGFRETWSTELLMAFGPSAAALAAKHPPEQASTACATRADEILQQARKGGPLSANSEFRMPLAYAVSSPPMSERRSNAHPDEAIFVFEDGSKALVMSAGRHYTDDTVALDPNQIGGSFKQLFSTLSAKVGRKAPVLFMLNSDTPLRRVRAMVEEVPKGRAVGLAVQLSPDQVVANHLKLAPRTPAWAAEALRVRPTSDLGVVFTQALAACLPARGLFEEMKIIDSVERLGADLSRAMTECECKGLDVEAAWSILLFLSRPTETAGWIELSTRDIAALKLSTAATLGVYARMLR